MTRLQLSDVLHPEVARSRDYAKYVADLAQRASAPSAQPTLEPLDFDQRSGNELRPRRFDEMVGQERLKALLKRIIANAHASGRPLDHMLLVGSAGTGKTTLAQICAHELGRRVFMLKAPVAYDLFVELAEVGRDGDVAFIDEIHMQVSGDRRGVTQAADPETFYHVMEDKRLLTPTGVQDFPAITFIGATTDAGLLPEPFLKRFPLTPQLDEYTDEEMYVLALQNAASLRMNLTPEAAVIFAGASRDTPRQVNTYIRNARSLAPGAVDQRTAEEIVLDLNSTTLDGLTRDMQNMLLYLLNCRREDAKGTVRYQAGVGSVATALGKSRDQKSIALFVEPWLIKQGYVTVTHGGRALTDKGVERARGL